ncbi:Cyclin N-terminal domain-containing protein [Mycena indigotica]|uniref:Cyclin N-terminal domain-containing protein n=1 Tax=Mycena indigotica TaxID=2126181 RepID=A0A8H6SZC8_9AGAR|nr:Cyclin N-terminal domain-containing protein [Mycena indigotica]KAF7306670.1 Cyclin N-terminal domain-containing protein [Mycena indigotica]
MKDVSVLNKHSRNSLVYPKKRPSPHGITKSHKTPILHPPRKTPRSAKALAQQQKQQQVQQQALRREGVLLEEEYRDDIRHYMHEMEVSLAKPSYWFCLNSLDQRYTMSSLQSMDQQPEIRWHMRPCLVDFLVEVHFTFRLRPETLYLTLNIVDRYVSRRIVYIKHYQLVGCAALWIAAKFEDAKDRVPTVQDLAQICRDEYDDTAFIQMEGHILSTIQWTLGHPTAEAWLRLMCVGACVEDAKVQHVARFLMEITLFYREFVKFSPSTIALAALTLARYLCGKPRRIWDESEECFAVINYLDTRLSKHVNDLSETLVKKYSYAFYSKAATFVVQYYLQGGHYIRPLTLPLPATPIRSPSSTASTPMTASDKSDDFPVTPTTPAFSSDPFGGLTHSTSSDKENMPTSFEPVVNKHRIETAPEQFLPHDFVTFGRTALHTLNNVSPRAMVP